MSETKKRKRVEEKVSKASEEWLTTFDSMADGVEIIGVDFEIRNVNAALCKILGKPKEELIGKKCYQIFHGRDAPISGCLLEKVKLSKQKETMEIFEPTLNAWLFVTASPILSEDGEVIKVVHLVRDITERKRAEEALRESEDRYHRLVELSPDTIAIHSEGKIVFINTAGARLLGAANPEELIGKPTMDFLHHDSHDIVKERLRQIYREGKDASLTEEKFMRLDGTVVDVEVAAIPFTYQGKPAVQAIARDITERKRVEEALRESEERHRTIFEQAADSIVLIDAEIGALVEFNDRAHESLGYTREEFERLKIPDFEALESAQEVAKRIEKIIKEGADTFETKHRTKGGVIRDIQVSSRAISIRGRDFVQSIWRDITERKQAEEEISHRAKQLALINEIGQRIAPILELPELYHTVVEAIQEKFGYQNVAIFSVRGDEILLEAVAGPEAKLMPPDYAQKMGEGMVGWVAQNGKTLLANDVTKEPRFLHLDYLDVAAEVDVPIRLGDKTIGVLMVDSDRPYAFTEVDVTTLETITDQVARAIENARLYEETRRKAEELAAVYGVSLDVAAQLELPVLLKTIFLKAMQLLGTSAGGLYLYRPERQELEMIVHRGLSKDYTGTRMALGEGICGRVAQSGEPMVVNDYANWEGKSPQFADEPPFNVLAVPIKRGDTLLGVLYVDDLDLDRKFDEADIRLVTLFANQAAIAIENARLYEQTDEKLRRRVAELSALNVIAESLTSTLELDEILTSIVTRVAQVTQARICTVRLFEGEELTIGAAVGYRDDSSRHHSINIDQRLREIVQERKPLMVEDLWTADIPESRKERAQKEGVHAFLGVPMISRGNTIGILSIYREKAHRFNEWEVRLLSTIANQVAIAIDNTRLYERLKEHTTNLERLVVDRTKELQALQAELQHTAKLASLGQMAAGIAHELNNPLGAISGYLELMQEEWHLAEPAQGYVERIEQRVKQATKIVRELRDFGTPGEPVWEKVDINAVLEETLNLVERQLSFHKVNLLKYLSPSLPPVPGDPDRLGQVFMNLILNARQAMPQGGELKVATQMTNDQWIEIIIADAGEGIEEKNLLRIFEPFFTTRPPGEGMGLGLSLSYRIIRDHGGTIDVWSRRGTGSVFRVTLPTSQAKKCWEIIGCGAPEDCPASEERAGYRCWPSAEGRYCREKKHGLSGCEACPVYEMKALPPLNESLLSLRRQMALPGMFLREDR